MNSGTVLAGNEGCTSKTPIPRTMLATGAMSRTKSKLSLSYRIRVRHGLCTLQWRPDFTGVASTTTSASISAAGTRPTNQSGGDPQARRAEQNELDCKVQRLAMANPHPTRKQVLRWQTFAFPQGPLDARAAPIYWLSPMTRSCTASAPSSAACRATNGSALQICAPITVSCSARAASGNDKCRTIFVLGAQLGARHQACEGELPCDRSCDRNATLDDFFEVCVPHAPQLSQFFCTKQPRTGRWHKLVRMGGAMRELLGSEIPDTAPYTEWLAIVGSMVVAVLVCAVLFSTNGVLT
jgi:hypothetical protein